MAGISARGSLGSVICLVERRGWGQFFCFFFGGGIKVELIQAGSDTKFPRD